MYIIGKGFRDDGTNHLESSVPIDAMQAWEYAALKALTGPDDYKHLALMQRMAPYLRGNHHVEDIMWRENMSRSELSTGVHGVVSG